MRAIQQDLKSNNSPSLNETIDVAQNCPLMSSVYVWCYGLLWNSVPRLLRDTSHNTTSFGHSLKPITVKLYHVITIWVHFIMQVQKFGGLSPGNIWGKNMPNLGRFYTTFEFVRQYLQNETRYPKSESYMIDNDSSRVQPNKSGELLLSIK